MKAALAVVLGVTPLAPAMAAAAPVPAIVEYGTMLAGRTQATGGATVGVLEPQGQVALQVRMTFADLSDGLAGANFHFTDSGADVPATLSLPGLPVGENGGAYADNFYLVPPAGTPIFSPEYISRYGTNTAPFLALLQRGALSLVVQTGAFPNGELRGTLSPVTSPVPVPLPRAIAPMLAALFILGAMAARVRSMTTGPRAPTRVAQVARRLAG